MRTTETLTSTCVPQSPVTKAWPKDVLAVMVSIFRVFRNRRQINRLHELDDNQLRDIGLERHDVEQAFASSTFFEDPSAHLTSTARRRSRSALAVSYRS